MSHITHASLLFSFIPRPFYQAFYRPPYIGHNGLALLLLRENGANAEWLCGARSSPQRHHHPGAKILCRPQLASYFSRGVVLPDFEAHLYRPMRGVEAFISVFYFRPALMNAIDG